MGTKLPSKYRRFCEARTFCAKQWCRNVRIRINKEVKDFQQIHPRFQPSLVIIQAGSRPDSTTYVRMKLKAAVEANILAN